MSSFRSRHGDHLGSVSLVTDHNGAMVSRQDFAPFGTVRSGGVGQTTLNFTGQHRDSTGLLFYNARYYDPALGKFLSPDTLVPGTASGTGGGAATLGYDDRTALAPLTVAFHEPDFLAGLNAEHGFTQAQGFWFQLSAGEQRQAKVGWGPANPQALNRYAYVLNNPVRYTDPTGHASLVDDLREQCLVLTAGFCGGVVVNWTSEPMRVYGSRYVASCEGIPNCKAVNTPLGIRYVQENVIVTLQPGESSVQKGMFDADGVVIADGLGLKIVDSEILVAMDNAWAIFDKPGLSWLGDYQRWQRKINKNDPSTRIIKLEGFVEV